MTLTEHPLVDAILARHADVLGGDAQVYRNHVLRGLNYQALLLGRPVSDHAALAWAVHDLGIWTDGTFDYLQPSAALVDRLAGEFGIGDPARATSMVLEHHKVRACPEPEVETFRQADLIDVSRGLLRAGLRRTDIHAVAQALPYLGFHRWLVTNLTRNALRHPTRPAPMLRW